MVFRKGLCFIFPPSIWLLCHYLLFYCVVSENQTTKKKKKSNTIFILQFNPLIYFVNMWVLSEHNENKVKNIQSKDQIHFS